MNPRILRPIEWIGAIVPLSTLGLMRRAEIACQLIQGKGLGAASVAAEVAAIVPLLPARGAVVFDVGAHKGRWTRALLARAEARVSCVYAFEPSSANLEYLAAIRGVEVVAAAVGGRDGSGMLYSNEPGASLGSLYQRRLDHLRATHTPQEVVRVITLDAFAEERDVRVIHFMKMDIEGSELAALRGAGRLLASGRIRALSFEFGDCNLDSRTYYRDLWDTLTAAGFKIFRIVPRGRLLPIRRYTMDLESFAPTNYVAVLEATSQSER